MRWLWQRRTNDARSWHELPDETKKVIEAMFMASIYVELSFRKTLFWTDLWLQSQSITDLASCLHNDVGAHIKKQRTVLRRLYRMISGSGTFLVL